MSDQVNVASGTSSLVLHFAAGDAGLRIVETGLVGRMDMQFVLASVPRQAASYRLLLSDGRR